MSDPLTTTENGLPQSCATADRVRETRVVAVTSGKGGVGKTNFVANVAIALQKKRKRVLVLDADLGLANIDIILGLRPLHNIFDVIEGRKSVDEIIVRGPGGIDILPAGTALDTLAELDERQKLLLMERLEPIDGRYDFILVDTGAGISSNVLYFALAAQIRVVVVTPEPTSRTDAYAVIKILNKDYSQKRFHILVNQAESESEGRRVYEYLADTADKHLGDVSLGFLGVLATDSHVGEAIKLQRPVIEQFPQSRYASQVKSIGSKIAGLPAPGLDGSLGFFWRRLIQAGQPG
jgi:flagellar biosynthesis protein FlhG